MAVKKTPRYFLETFDAHTNEALAGFSGESATEVAWQERLCFDATKHRLFECPLSVVRLAVNSRHQQSLRFDTWIQWDSALPKRLTIDDFLKESPIPCKLVFAVKTSRHPKVYDATPDNLKKYGLELRGKKWRCRRNCESWHPIGDFCSNADKHLEEGSVMRLYDAADIKHLNYMMIDAYDIHKEQEVWKSLTAKRKK